MTTSAATSPRRGRRVAAWLSLALGLLGAAGCSLPLPQAEPDPTRTYILSIPAVATAAPNATAPAVRLRPIEVPTYLRPERMVVRHGANEIERREFARWGEPLERGITRVLREELIARGAASSVDTPAYRSSAAGDVAYEIGVRILACEGRVDGSVDFDAVWEIDATGGKGAPAQRGEYRAKGIRWTPHKEATLAASLSEAVAGLAAELATALENAKH